MANRDNFSEKTKNQIAKRAGWLCSFPSCRAHTVGATEDGKGEVNIGIAAHICAAAPGGPRWKEDMLPDDRSSADNGIWLCQNHAKVIDSDPTQYPADLLHEWKKQAAAESLRRVLSGESASAPVASTDSDQTARLRAAATKDLEVFKQTEKWPRSSVPLTLEVEGFEAPVTTDALARVVTTLDDLILVAGPGMGKTTTLFQIAAGVLESASGVPLVVLLNEWATEGASVLESILKRPAYTGVSEAVFRKAAAQPGVVLLLDGWNEMNADARRRARVQVNALKAELPELGLVVSARKPRNQALDVPFSGKRVDLLPLSEEQQVRIARTMRGEEGVKLLDQAWRTAGVRELVAIPLYLTALLSFPKGAPFPTTKEEVLRHFVTAHEKEASRAEALQAVVQDFQQDYLDGLAAFATSTANTAIADTNARQSVSNTVTMLVSNGQITVRPEPNAVLDVLVVSHVLMRAGDTPSVSFQHQQFQEYYASHSVERRILSDIDDTAKRETLKAEILNFPAWEEAILFAVERMSRGDAAQRVACGKAILAAFEVDPLLAADMIFRSTDDVWSLIASPIKASIKRWHTPGKVDRAFRFMLTSGRAEFLNAVWPLITDENEQVSLKALRNCKRFRPSVLGKGAAAKIKALPEKPRLVLLQEIASHSGMDGLDLATGIAKDDPAPAVKASVIDALAFRRADRHVADILRTADESTFDLISRRGLIDVVADPDVRKGIEAARERLAAKEDTVEDRLRLIAYSEGQDDRSAELTQIVSTMEIDKKQGSAVQLLYEAKGRYPGAIAEGLLARVRAGLKLFYGADDILAAAGFVLEDDDLLKLATESPAVDSERADAAASVLGPKSVGAMIDALLELVPRIRTDRTASEAFSDLERRIGHTPGASLTVAVVQRSAHLDNEQMARLAALFSRRRNEDDGRGRPFDADATLAIQGLVEDWGKRMLASADAQRWQKAAIATLASRFPDPRMLPLIKEMTDDNLRRYREFRAQAEKDRWRQTEAVHEAYTPFTGEYQWAFLAIKTPETAAMMRDYLEDEHFGALAARVLANQWHSANEPPKNKQSLGGVDWSEVKSKRAARAANPAATSTGAETIFAAIDRLLADSTTDAQKKLAVSLGITALRLPHGQRPETIRKLIANAPRHGHETGRWNLLLSLVLSGEEIDVADVNAGIAETLEAAVKDKWILTQSEGWHLRVWLQLIPFVNEPLEALPVLLSLPATQREPHALRDVVRAFAHSPSPRAEDFLFKLAEADPRFYALHEWRDSVGGLGTLSSARQFVDLAASGIFSRKTSNDWHLTKQLGGLIVLHPDLRPHVYGLLKDGATSMGLAMLAGAVAERPDEEGLMLLVKCEQYGLNVRGWRTIEGAVTEHVPVDGYSNAYNVVPVAAPDLRRKLFALTTDGGPKDVAARWLTHIDNIRDEYGLPGGEPRHPDLASGKPWPIMTPDPGASAD